MIRLAISHTRFYMGEPPALGMITFVNEDKVKPKANPGACFIHAGFTQLMETIEVAGVAVPTGNPLRTVGGLLVFQMLPPVMPAPMVAAGELFG